MKAIEFDEYAASMRPRAMSLSRRQARHHPFLDADDLLQEAMIALWSVWQKQPKKPLDELQKIGHVAMTRRLACVFQRQFRFGIARPTVPDFTHPDAVWDRGPWGQGKWIGPVTITSLDAPVSDDSDTPLIELLPGTDGHEPSVLIDLEQALSPDEQRVLHELLSPSRQTLMALRQRLRDMEEGGIEEPELATLSTCLGWVLQLTETFTRETLERIRLHFRGSQYIQGQTERNSQPTHKEGTNMINDTKAAELGIDPGELVNPNGSDGAVETEKPAAKSKAEKKAKAEKAPKPKAEKKVAEKAPKAKAEKKPAKAKAAKKDGDRPSGGPYSNKAPKGLLEAGSFVKYKGGANLRNSWLKTGMVGRVFGFRLNKNGGARYCIRFEGGKGTIMSASHVEKTAAPAPKAKAPKAAKKETAKKKAK